MIHTRIKTEYFANKVDFELDMTEAQFDEFKRKLQKRHNEKE